MPNRLQKDSASQNIEVPEATESENLFLSNDFFVPKMSIKTEGTLVHGNPVEPDLIMKYEETDGFTGQPFEFEEIVYTENHANFDKGFIVKDWA